MRTAAYPAAVSYRLKLARTGVGFTKAEMAKALKVSRRKYAGIEKTGVIPQKLMVEICVTTRCSAEYLLSGIRHEPHEHTLIQHDNVTVRLNPCGGPCTVGPFWCHEECLKHH